MAARAGQTLQLELLIANGGNPSIVDSSGHTPAEIAKYVAFYTQSLKSLETAEYLENNELQKKMIKTKVVSIKIRIEHNFLRSNRVLWIFFRSLDLDLMTENVFVIDVERRGGRETAELLRTAFASCFTTASSYGYFL